MDILEETARRWIKERGVEIQDIADLVYFLQNKYHENLQMEDCIANVERVLSKREVQNAILIGFSSISWGKGFIRGAAPGHY